jgi:hypothetical protein
MNLKWWSDWDEGLPYTIGIVSFIIYVVLVGIFSAPLTAQAKDGYSRDVTIINITPTTRYVVDKMRGLCFYETATSYVATSIQIDCKNF